MGIRPSSLYSLSDELTAFTFDKAVVTFGVAVEADLDEFTKDETKPETISRKRTERFTKWMKQEQKFRDPMKG